nr:MAG TPA: hypothetical protein [Caudoviricetes sp.]
MQKFRFSKSKNSRVGKLERGFCKPYNETPTKGIRHV